MSRGRIKENNKVLSKWEIKSKNEYGETVTYSYDKKINSYGPHKVEVSYPKGSKGKKPKIDNKSYNKTHVVVVFKTSSRKNAKLKIKTFPQNIDYIISADKLPGIPQRGEIIDLAVGKSFIEKFKNQYNICE